MIYSTILYEIHDSVVTITLNRPGARNALTLDMIEEMKDALAVCAGDRQVRAVLLTGAGEGFSSGADLKQMSALLVEQRDISDILRGGLNRLTMMLRELPKPVVAAVNGVAAGAGASLALAADVRVASENATFVFAAFANLGLIPDAGATYLLPRLLGEAKALELLLLANAQNRVSAADAFTMGIVNRVVPHDDLSVEARTMAAKLAQMPTRAIGMTKQAVYDATEKGLAAALEAEARLQGEASRTRDFREGVQAMLEKRQPSFTGE